MVDIQSQGSPSMQTCVEVASMFYVCASSFDDPLSRPLASLILKKSLRIALLPRIPGTAFEAFRQRLSTAEIKEDVSDPELPEWLNEKFDRNDLLEQLPSHRLLLSDPVTARYGRNT